MAMNEKGKGKKAGGSRSKPLRGARPGKNNSTSASQLKREEWATEIYGLRVYGYSYRQIAEHMREAHAPESFSLGRVYELFQVGRTMRMQDRLEEVFDQHVDRLAQLRSAVMDAANAGDVQALDRVLKIDEIERNLLGIAPGAPDATADADPKATLQAKLDAAMKRLAPKLH